MPDQCSQARRFVYIVRANSKTEGKPTRAKLPFAPDFAVEVLSPSIQRPIMDKKLKEYFAAGARLVWYIEPELRTARVFTAVDQCEDIRARTAILDGGDVLPGFELSLAKLFEKAGPRIRAIGRARLLCFLRCLLFLRLLFGFLRRAAIRIAVRLRRAFGGGDFGRLELFALIVRFFDPTIDGSAQFDEDLFVLRRRWPG